MTVPAAVWHRRLNGSIPIVTVNSGRGRSPSAGAVAERVAISTRASARRWGVVRSTPSRWSSNRNCVAEAVQLGLEDLPADGVEHAVDDDLAAPTVVDAEGGGPRAAGSASRSAASRSARCFQYSMPRLRDVEERCPAQVDQATPRSRRSRRCATAGCTTPPGRRGRRRSLRRRRRRRCAAFGEVAGAAHQPGGVAGTQVGFPGETGAGGFGAVGGPQLAAVPHARSAGTRPPPAGWRGCPGRRRGRARRRRRGCRRRGRRGRRAPLRACRAVPHPCQHCIEHVFVNATPTQEIFCRIAS